MRLSLQARLWLKWFAWRRRCNDRRVHNVLKDISFGPSNPEASVQFVMLLCERNVIEAAATLSSLLRFLDSGTWGLTIHDDGSIKPSSLAFLRSLAGHFAYISRLEADKAIEAYLRENNYLRLLEFRCQNAVNLKAVDFPFFHNGRIIIQLDSDILFFQRPTELLAPSSAVRFNVDRGPALAYHAKDITDFLGGNVVDPLFNGGIVAFNADLSFHATAESILQKDYPKINNWTVEQTLTAMHLASAGQMCRLPPAYDVSFALLATNGFKRGSLVTQHYCAWARPLMKGEFLRFVAPTLRPPSSILSSYYAHHLTHPLPNPREW